VTGRLAAPCRPGPDGVKLLNVAVHRIPTHVNLVGNVPRMETPDVHRRLSNFADVVAAGCEFRLHIQFGMPRPSFHVQG
jgi:hypothetical protein